MLDVGGTTGALLAAILRARPTLVQLEEPAGPGE